MPVLNKIGVSLATLVSVVALSAGTPPASASQPAQTVDPSASVGARCTESWKNAVGVPGRWTTIKDDTCALLGSAGLKVKYQWAAERGRPCIKVRGFVNGRDKWYDAGCGKAGSIKVPWGNVAANKMIKVKGFSLFKWR